MHTNRLKIYKKKRFWVGILLAQLFLIGFLKKRPYFLELHQKMYSYIHPLLQSLFSVFPFSFGDVFYFALFFLLVFLLVKRKWRSLLILMNVFFFVYQMLWGVLYSYSSLDRRLPKVKYSEEDLKSIALYFYNECKKNEENSVLSENEISIYLQKAISFLPKEWSVLAGKGDISCKKSLYSSPMSYTGISGYYNPFTAEAQYNANLPVSIKTFSISHETAHQLGFAREQEASFIGYLLMKNARQPRILYYANWYNLKRILYELEDKDEKFVTEIRQKFTPKMKSDLQKEKVFFSTHQSFFIQLFYKTNDWFLKLNGQEGSVTYSYYLDLLIRYEKPKMK